MSERKSSAYIGDILNCIKHIANYTGNLSFDEFSSDFMVVEACLYNIQIIGEAVSKLSEVHYKRFHHLETSSVRLSISNKKLNCS